MKRLSNITITMLMFTFALLLSIPFINGAGCHALLYSDADELGVLHGRCEQGTVYVTVSHKVTKQTYLAEGTIAYIGNYYFILINKREISPPNNSSTADWEKGSFFYRNVYSGVIQHGPLGTYLLSSSPAPLLMKIDVYGVLGFVGPKYD